jgi:hypothetical protein
VASRDRVTLSDWRIACQAAPTQATHRLSLVFA